MNLLTFDYLLSLIYPLCFIIYCSLTKMEDISLTLSWLNEFSIQYNAIMFDGP